MYAGSIRSSKDRAQVVWILDAVQHHQERRTRRTRYEFRDAVVRRSVDFSHHSLVHAVMCIAVERIRRDAAGTHAALTRERDELRQTRVTAFTNS
jgi:hypothetical protein